MNWSYHWSISPAPVQASGTGTVSMALGWGGPGADKILAAAVTTSSVAPINQPDFYYKNFNLTLHINDNTSHQSGQLTFAGHISGLVSGSNANLHMYISTPLEYLKLGREIFSVRLPASMLLLKPGASYVPTMYATVQTWPWTPPAHQPVTPNALVGGSALPNVSPAAVPAAATTPEPSTLVLAGLGVSLLGFGGIGRNRRPPLRPAA
jgi:hypothetical protein